MRKTNYFAQAGSINMFVIAVLHVWGARMLKWTKIVLWYTISMFVLFFCQRPKSRIKVLVKLLFFRDDLLLC